MLRAEIRRCHLKKLIIKNLSSRGIKWNNNNKTLHSLPHLASQIIPSWHSNYNAVIFCMFLKSPNYRRIPHVGIITIFVAFSCWKYRWSSFQALLMNRSWKNLYFQKWFLSKYPNIQSTITYRDYYCETMLEAKAWYMPSQKAISLCKL